MTLKKQSILVSVGSSIIMVLVMGFMLYGRVLSDFQIIENQRVERSLKSLQFALKDKQKQLEEKISDWAMWDDTYEFIVKKNPEYIESNLTQESFYKLGVHHVLYINTAGGLVEQFHLKSSPTDKGNGNDVYSIFATGSALIQSYKDEIHQTGIIRIPEGIFIYTAESILKSDGSGPPRGIMIFTQRFDKTLIASLKALTQSEVRFESWDTPMSSDFTSVRNKITIQKPTTIEIVNDKKISGYLLLSDAYNSPLGIIRIDSKRDIILQGKSNIFTLMILLLLCGGVGVAVNYWLMDTVVLKGILSIAQELKEVGKTKSHTNRLKEKISNNELETLRININNMLSDIENSQKLLKVEVGARESLIELIDSIVVMLDVSAHIIMINKHGCEILGFSHEELIGKDWIEKIIIPEEKEMIRRKFNNLMNAQIQDNTYIENSIKTKEGKILIYGWHNTVLKDSEKSVISTLSVGNDITEIKKEAQNRENYTNTLKQMNDVMIGRELKMIELKKRIEELEKNK